MDHEWELDLQGSFVCANCGEWRWPDGAKGLYRMNARDSVTGERYSWIYTGPKPDLSGASYPGPNSPVDVSVFEKRTMPVFLSCDEIVVADVMES